MMPPSHPRTYPFRTFRPEASSGRLFHCGLTPDGRSRGRGCGGLRPPGAQRGPTWAHPHPGTA
eukprot:13221474-Alexandrium_andersonii.AAC.1